MAFTGGLAVEFPEVVTGAMGSMFFGMCVVHSPCPFHVENVTCDAGDNPSIPTRAVRMESRETRKWVSHIGTIVSIAHPI